MGLTTDALARLKQRRDEAYYRPWKPGQQLTDDELLWDYIEKLTNNLSLAKDEAFLHSDLIREKYERESLERANQGTFG